MKKLFKNFWFLIPFVLLIIFGIIILATALTKHYYTVLIFTGMEIMTVIYICCYCIFKMPNSSVSHSKTEEDKQGGQQWQ